MIEERCLHRWVCGWATSRGLAPPLAIDGGWRVEVGLPDQQARLVFPGLNPGFRQALKSVRDADVLLKVCGTPFQVAAVLTAPWRLESVSTFMTLDAAGLTACAPVAPPAGYRLEHGHDDGRRRVWIFDRDDLLAASGVAVKVEGAAVFDRIETAAAHRRRGLGRAVMSALQSRFAQDGAGEALLVATEDGRALYASLGWRPLGPYCTLRRRSHT